MQNFKIKIVLLTCLSLSLASCLTAPKAEPIPDITTNLGYSSAYQITKAYIEKCLNPVNMRSNLYTEFPEAEIVVDSLGHAYGYMVGTAYVSHSKKAEQVIGINFKESNSATTITSKTKLSYHIVQNALDKKPCALKANQ